MFARYVGLGKKPLRICDGLKRVRAVNILKKNIGLGAFYLQLQRIAMEISKIALSSTLKYLPFFCMEIESI